ncbi:MAG: tetratricopeptide repeat protein [Planctomycetota bacterium]
MGIKPENEKISKENLNFQADTPIHRHLIELFSHQKAVVFCGAGVSLEPPAGLPDWHKLRDYTLEAVASKDPVLQKYLKNLTDIDMIAQPCKRGLTPEYVASNILANCEGYFECFRALEEGEPNANHKYLAKMAKAGCLKYIITMNFDLFIEQGMEREGLSYRVYRNEKEFAAFAGSNENTVHILKLHGCISEPTTITATIEQEGKGLSTAKIKVLQELLTHYHFVFWGYSGADLKLDLDYLCMVSMKEKAQGFVWNFLKRGNYEEPVNPHVAQLKEQYSNKAYIVHSKLPEIFDTLLASKDHIERVTYTQDQEMAWQEEKNRKLAQSFQKWAKEHLVHSDACNIFGGLLRHSGQMDAALECYQRFSEITKSLENKQNYSIALNNIGLIYKDRGEYLKALEYYLQAEKIARAMGDKKELATDLNNIGTIYHALGEYHKALKYYLQAEKISLELGDKQGLATDLNNIGLIYHALGEYHKALEYYLQTEKISLELGDKQELSTTLNNIGTIYYDREDYENALEYFLQAETIARTMGDKKKLSTTLNNIGMIYKDREDYENAFEYFLQTEKIARELGNKQGLATAFNNIRLIYNARREYDKALEYGLQAEKILHELGDKQGLATAFNNIGWTYQARREYDKALEYMKKSLQIFESIGNIPNAAVSSENIGSLYEKNLRQFSNAIKFYKKGTDYFGRLGQKGKVAELKKRIKQCRGRRS